MRHLLCSVFFFFSIAGQAAELQVPEQFDLLRVNGQEYKTYFQRTKTVALHLGRNEIEMEFNQLYDAEHGDSHDRIRSKPFTVSVEVENDSDVWQLHAAPPESRADALSYSKNPTYLLQKNGRPLPINKVTTETTVSLSTNEDAFAMLNLWWAKASVEQRQAFLKEVLSKH